MKLEIAYRLTARSGILIGATAEALSIGLDKTTIRRRSRRGSLPGKKQEPVIPGSTIKGKLRNACELILQALGQPVCLAPRAELMCPHNARVNEELDKELIARPCAVCRLFGSADNRIDEPARLFFDDAVVALESGLTPFATRTQAGVSLSRQRRTAEDDRLYLIERGLEGLRYKGNIAGYAPDELARQSAALLIAALDSLVAIGGGKSRGAGWTAVEIINVGLGDQRLSEPSSLSRMREELKLWRVSK